MSYIPLNGNRVIEAVESALHSRTSAANQLRGYLEPEANQLDYGDAPDGTNGATKSARAVDPSQGMGARLKSEYRDPLLEAVTKTINR